MIIERTTDIGYIKSCVTHPKIWGYVSDDGSPSPDQYEPPMGDTIYWLTAIDGNKRVGVFMLHPHNSICYEVHTCLLPEIWGRTVECTLDGIKWMFANTSCRRIITNVPEYNEMAFKLAERSGLKRFGVNMGSFQKNGVLYNQIMLGISKEN